MGKKVTPKSYILYMLSRREYSKKELYDKMIEKVYFEKDDIEKALKWAEEYNYLSDEKFAESNINYKLHHKGNNQIRFLLKDKGISDEIIEEALSKSVGESDRAIKTLLKYRNSKIKDKEIDMKIKDKAFRFMASRGFSYNNIKDAWDTIFSEEFDEDEFLYNYDLKKYE